MGATSSSPSSPRSGCLSANRNPDKELMKLFSEAVCDAPGGGPGGGISQVSKLFGSREECVEEMTHEVRKTLCTVAPPPPLEKVAQLSMAAATCKSSRVHALVGDQVPVGISPEEFCEREVKRSMEQY